MEKLDLKKQWKQLYGRSTGAIVCRGVPPLTYLMVDGEGDPNTSQSFSEAIEALYSLSYTLKFTLKKEPARYRLRRDAAGGIVVGRRSPQSANASSSTLAVSSSLTG